MSDGSRGAAAASTAASLDQGEIFESFFANSCAFGSPSGDLDGRCTESLAVDPTKPLSTDSQASLAPTQALSSNENILFRAQSLNRMAGERMEARRGGEANEPLARAILGAVIGGAFLTLLVVPALYTLVAPRKVPALEA